MLALGPRLIVKARNILWKPTLVRLALQDIQLTYEKNARLSRETSMRFSVTNAYVSLSSSQLYSHDLWLGAFGSVYPNTHRYSHLILI